MYDPTSEVAVVMSYDPALDWPNDEAKEAYLKRREPDLWRAVVREGMRPTVYHCKPAVPVVGYAADKLGGRERYMLLFLACCHHVTLSDGRELKCEQKSLLKNGRFMRVAPDEWINEVANAVGLDAMYDIGQVIDERVHMKAEDRGPL